MDIGYPESMQMSDGRILTVYYFNLFGVLPGPNSMEALVGQASWPVRAIFRNPQGSRRAHKALALSAAVAAALLIASHIQAFQGMTSPSRKGRPVDVKTNLPPIQVDFRDVAEAAGLKAVNVSGGVTRKKYLIEATGMV